MIKSLYRLFLQFSENKYRKRINHLFSLLELDKGLFLVDVGAAGQIMPRWKRVEKFLNYYGFEPDERSRLALLKHNNGCMSYQLDEKILSNKNEVQEIHFCKAPMTSSTFPPNRAFVDLFSEADRFNVVSKEKLDATSLDTINLPKTDFIKLDIQGGELNALHGSSASLKKCFGLEIEVEFLPIYKEQPLYSDITNFLKEHDFVFIDFLRICRWERDDIYTNLGQAAWGDALYLRSPEYVASNYTDQEQIKKFIAICLLYHKFDLVKRLSVLIESDSFLSAKFKKELSRFERRFRKSKWIKEGFNKFVKLFLYVDEEIHLFH